jgi:hypothetical protein
MGAFFITVGVGFLMRLGTFPAGFLIGGMFFFWSIFSPILAG